MLSLIVVTSVFYLAWQCQTTNSPAIDQDLLFQLSAFNTFTNGSYAGTMTYSNLSKQGDFGIGTFDGLDGEMIALDGIFYQIPSDGIPKEVQPMQTSPYATVTFFEADQTFRTSDLNYTQLQTFLDNKLIVKNAIYAIKISGTFTYAQTRSPQKQVEPYPKINDALKTQSVFPLNNVSASAVGFWFPSNMDGVDYAGYHFHLITDDHTAGGHLLDCIVGNIRIEVDQINRYQLFLP